MKNFLASVSESESEFIVTACSQGPLGSSGKRTFSNAAIQLRRGNHEKDALKHCFGSSGISCMGADHAAATYERARGTATAAADYNHDNHYGRNRDNYGIHSGEWDRPKGK